MRVNGIPNKFKIFQDFYFRQNGVEISYREALHLFYQMDGDTEQDFMEYYIEESGMEVQYAQVPKKDKDGNLLKDEDGNIVYEKVAIDPFGKSNGYNFDRNFVVEKTGTKTVTKKVVKKDKAGKPVLDKEGNYVYEEKEVEVGIYSNNRAQFTKSLIGQKYSMEAFAAKMGYVLDPQWSQYSAEEIVAMEENGVVIPEEILDIAHTIVATDTGLTDDVNDIEGEVPEEKPSFLDLIPAAKKHIQKCDEKTEKINDKVEDLIQENNKENRSIFDKIEEQKASLKEYEEMIREWRHLQDKVNNGETLTDSEARRYAKITGMLNDKNSGDDFQLDKNHIARALNDINILAVLGEQLANETIEIGKELKDFTSDKNYKSTAKHVSGQIGFFGMIVAMILGKRLASEAVEIGNDTKEYTEETNDSVMDIASVMGVEKMIANPASGASETPQQEVAEEKIQTAQDEQATEPAPVENEPVKNEDKDNEAAQDAVEGGVPVEVDNKEEEDFIINDENVLSLIGDTTKINADLFKQIAVSLIDLKSAKDEQNYVKNATKLIDKIVKEYQEEEARRQQEIQAKQQEIDDAQEKIDEINGGEEIEDSKEAAKEYGIRIDDEENNKEKEDEIAYNQEIIDRNTQDIEVLNEETDENVENVKEKTSPVKEHIDEAVEDESKALINDNEYKEEIIPEDKDTVNLTDASGKTLTKMGKYRVTVGMEMIAKSLLNPYLYHLGTKHIVKGTISMGIGFAAQLVSASPIPEFAEKSTDAAVKEEDKAIEGLTETDAKIVEVTGEEAAQGDVEEGLEDETAQEPVEDTMAEGKSGSTSVSETAPEQAESATLGDDTSLSDDVEQIPANEEQTDDIEDTEDVEKTEDKVPSVDDAEKEPQKAGEETDNVAKLPISGGKKKDKEEVSTDKAGDMTKKAYDIAKDDSKDSEKVKKDTEKDEKQLGKEAKRLQKQMKKDEKDIIRMTKESQRAAKRQQEILVRYEEITAENEELAAQEQQKQMSKPSQIAQPQQQSAEQQNGGLAVNSFGMVDSSQSTTSDNAAKLEANNVEITALSGEFKIHENKINRNRTKILKLQKNTKTNHKKFIKKTKIQNQKIKEAEKKEQDKQKRLAKQLAAVGIAENVFSITLATGTTMMLWPPTASAGAVLVKVGTYGLGSCSVTKAAINIANGNWQAALMGLGSTAVSIAGSFVPGVGGAANKVLTCVTQGLSVVSSSAELVNNVRAVQGKEASGIMSKIATVAGVASSVTSAASSLKNLGQTTSTFGKVASVASVVGTAMSSTSQIMTEFGLGNEKAAQMLGMIGGGISLAASAVQIGQSLKNKDNDSNKNSKDSKKTEDTKKPQTTTPTTTQKEETSNETKPSNSTKTGETPAETKSETAEKPVDETKKDVKSVSQATLATAVNTNLSNNSSSEQVAVVGDAVQAVVETNTVKAADLDAQNVDNTNVVKQSADEQTDAQNKQLAKKSKSELWKKGFEAVSGVMNAMSPMLASSAQANTTQKKKGAVSTSEYTDNKRFKAIQASNEAYFGHSGSEEHRRRLRRYAKLYA